MRTASFLVSLCAFFFLSSFCSSVRSVAQEDSGKEFSDAVLDERWSRDLKPDLVENITSKRGKIVLNGLWKFYPISSRAQSPTVKGWGYIHVPGSWSGSDRGVDVSILPGTGDLWKDFEGSRISRAFYEREIVIPESWKDRTILLNLKRVSTDAIIFVDGKEAGQAKWPSGSVDLTKYLTPGRSAKLRILVVATGDVREAESFLKTRNPVHLKSVMPLKSRGIVGGVELLSQPSGAAIRNLEIRTSTRKSEISVYADISGNIPSGSTELTAVFLNEKGEEEKRFAATLKMQNAGTNRAGFEIPWEKPRLWDTNHPNLYTLRLSVKSTEIDDEVIQTFGFREFWTEGRKFFLNGTEIRLRPDLYDATRSPEALIADGFNFAEIWPEDPDERGAADRDEEWIAKADVAGLLVSGRIASMTSYIYAPGYRFIWNDAEKTRWTAKAAEEIAKLQNHPSLVMWAHTANQFGPVQDQNPRLIGRADKAKRAAPPDGYRAGLEGCDVLKSLDPTRLVFTHEGGDVGNVFTVNTYLDFIPLQEREEWLSEWAKTGDMPYIGIEFGTPLYASFLRGRTDYGHAIVSEPFVTEFSAIYLGREAYRNETPEYRKNYANRFEKGQTYRFDWGIDRSSIVYSQNFQKIQTLFNTNTWRSWRTQGITGGMIPWERHGWQGDKRTESGDALVANNSATLAWICGPKDSFTAKTHSYKVDETVEKQVALLNDTRDSQPFKYAWKATVDGKPIASGEGKGKINPAETLLRQLRFSTPFFAKSKAEGEITLYAKIGEFKHEDQFKFRVFSRRGRRESAPTTLPVFDPGSKTADLLFSLDYAPRPWKGEKNAPIVIVGRESLSSGKPIPGDLEAYVRGGGRVLAFTQTPELLEKSFGFRVASALSRRAFPVNKDHPALRGLDATDFRDWRGASTLLPAKPEYSGDTPVYGWHWGNRGVVSSVPIEKPHYGSWRPILESEFDLAYSPLMEMDYHKGRIILCTLDLEDHAQYDAAADRFWQKLLNYALHAPLTPKAEDVVYVGGASDAAMLDRMGVIYASSDQPQFNAGLLKSRPGMQLAIIGSNSKTDAEALQAFLLKGGRVVFLPSNLISGHGVEEVISSKPVEGSLTVPDWPECLGLSVSDLRYRAERQSFLLESLPVFAVKQSNGKTIGTKNLIGANGLLGRLQIGKGVAIFCQIDPDSFDADNLTYFRLTRWRQTHALSLILSNMGASFKQDEGIFHPTTPEARAGKSGFYYPDYRTDFELGDDPYRYFRW